MYTGNKKQMKNKLRKGISYFMAISLIMVALGVQSQTAMAASMTSMSDNMSRLKASTASDHEIKFITPTGVSAGGTITLTFSADFTGVNSIVFGDVDFATAATCGGSFSDVTLAASPATTTWGVGSSGQVVTLTSATGTVTATNCVRIKIGLNAVVGASGAHQISNGAIDDDDTVALATSTGDSGTISVDIITDDQVVITATVDPSITFSLSDNAVQFGSLSAGDDKYATTSGGSSSPTNAHTLAAGTNATSGYVMYVMGATLTSGGNTITAPTGPSATTIGSEQFGLNLVVSGAGTGTADSQYGTSSQYGWGATVSTQDNIASASGATASNTYTARYVGNIAAETEAGAYGTTLTYTATATY
jgi:hypothetical protein